MLDFITSKFQIALDYVEDYISHGMTDVTFVIVGNTADVHGYHFVAGVKILLLPG